MSSGFKSFPRDEKSKLAVPTRSSTAKPWLGLKVSLFIGIPSITYRGWLLPEMDVILLSTTDVDAPGAPPVSVTVIPATRP